MTFQSASDSFEVGLELVVIINFVEDLLNEEAAGLLGEDGISQVVNNHIHKHIALLQFFFENPDVFFLSTDDLLAFGQFLAQVPVGIILLRRIHLVMVSTIIISLSVIKLMVFHGVIKRV